MPKICEHGGRGLIFPLTDAEASWEGWVRATVYLLAMLYLFLGVNIAADKFVAAIEGITSTKRRVLQRSTGRVITVCVWNGTVANLTLLALGSSAPEILLSVVEIIGNGCFAGELGPSTIVGSAAFNLFCIIGVCVMAIPAGEIRLIKDLGVFWVTAAFSIFAYLWLVLIVQVTSPNVIEVWEALVTLAWLPVLILVSYLTDIGWFSGVRKQPLIEKPVSLASDGEVPLATTQTSGSARQVWRHDLKRSRDYPDFYEGSETSCSQSDECSPGFSDPGVILDRRGYPYQNAAGIITFSEDNINISCGLEGREVAVPVFRKNGAQGTVCCKYRTEGLSAVAGYDFTAVEGELKWMHGEMRQEVLLEILPKQLSEAADQFQLILEEPEGGAMFNPNHDGSEEKCALTVTILNENDELTKNIAAMQMSHFVDKVINIDKMRLGAHSWYEAIVASVCDVTEDGERASTMDWLLHIISMPWKFTLSVLIPPTAYCGGWLCFVMAIGAIGGLTCAICDFAELFGCVTSLEDSITAITIVALGTSMPDLFASQTAAVSDKYADASIVNVTGSNSVNVFLGIGLPWSIAAIYWTVAGPTDRWLESYESYLGAWPEGAFIVQGGDLAFSVAVFNVSAAVALLIIHLRRQRLSGEPGGPSGMKVLSGILLISLWVFYIALSIWKIKSQTTDVGKQIFAIFIGFCSLENLVLLLCCALMMRFGTTFFTGRQPEASDEEAAKLCDPVGKDLATMDDLRHVGARPGLSPVAPPAFTVKEVHGRRPECYGRQNKANDISFTSAAFVCLAAKRLQRAARRVAERLHGLPPVPPPMFPPSGTLSPPAPHGATISRVPSFYSIDSEEGATGRPSITGRMAGLISGHAADWAALTVAGLAAGTLADPNGPRFLG